MAISTQAQQDVGWSMGASRENKAGLLLATTRVLDHHRWFSGACRHHCKDEEGFVMGAVAQTLPTCGDAASRLVASAGRRKCCSAWHGHGWSRFGCCRWRALKGHRGILRGAFLGDSVGAPMAAPRSLPAGDRAKGLSADPAVLNLRSGYTLFDRSFSGVCKSFQTINMNKAGSAEGVLSVTRRLQAISGSHDRVGKPGAVEVTIM